LNINQGILMKAAGISAGVGLVVGLIGGIPIINIACCCLGPIVMIATGITYGYFADQEGEAPDVGTWAAGGAICGVAASIGRGIFQVIWVGLSSLLGLGAATAQSLSQLEDLGLPPEIAGQVASSGANFVGVLVGVCISVFVFAALCAAAGAAYAAIKNNNRPQPAAV